MFETLQKQSRTKSLYLRVSLNASSFKNASTKTVTNKKKQLLEKDKVITHEEAVALVIGQ